MAFVQQNNIGKLWWRWVKIWRNQGIYSRQKSIGWWNGEYAYIKFEGNCKTLKLRRQTKLQITWFRWIKINLKRKLTRINKWLGIFT